MKTVHPAWVRVRPAGRARGPGDCPSERWQFVAGGTIRRHLVQRFPFSLAYEFESEYFSDRFDAFAPPTRLLEEAPPIRISGSALILSINSFFDHPARFRLPFEK
jgi:hypothetical protein